MEGITAGILKKIVVILCLSLLQYYGIIKARNQVFFVLFSKLRTYYVLIICQMDGWMNGKKRAAIELATKDMNLNLRSVKKVNNKSHWCQHHKLIDHSRGVSWPFPPRARAGGLAAALDLWSTVPTLSVWSYPAWHNWDSPFLPVVELDITSLVATCLGFYRHAFSVYCDVSLHSFSSGAQSLSSMKLLEMNESLSGAQCSLLSGSQLCSRLS